MSPAPAIPFRGKATMPDGAVLTEIPYRTIKQLPSAVDPYRFTGVDALSASKAVVELIESESLQDLLLRVDELYVIDSVVSVVPNLIILKKGGGFLLPHLNVEQILSLVCSVRSQVFVAQEGTDAGDQGKEKKSGRVIR